MLLNTEDKAYIWDIVDAANDILDFVRNIEFQDFFGNKMVRFSVERQLLVIGEAAHHISLGAKSDLPEIPWKQMIGLRNIIAHDYGEILAEKIWLVATKEIQPLIKKLSPFLEIE